MRQRVVSALVLIPIVVLLVLGGGWFAFGGAAVALVLGAWELREMFAHKGWHPPILLGALAGLAFLVAALLPNERVTLLALTVSGLLVVTFAWLIMTRSTTEGSLVDWALTMSVPLYLGWPLAFFLLLRGDTFGFNNRGFWWVLALFFIVWANDTFALLTGHYFGRHKLAPHVSPAKTWEGFIGGLIFSVIAARVFTLPLDIAWYHAVLLGILVAIAATIGDLAESLLKRGTGVKDSGTIIPGHGGILDRMDSLLFAVLVVFFYAAFLHGIPL